MKNKKLIISEQDFKELLKGYRVYLGQQSIKKDLERQEDNIQKEINELERLRNFVFLKSKLNKKIDSTRDKYYKKQSILSHIKNCEYAASYDYTETLFKTEECE
jgi:hypothetical protein